MRQIIALGGSCCPHYDGEAQRRPAFHRMLARGDIRPGIALEDGAAAHFVDDKLIRVVSSRPNARGYRLAFRAGQVRERALQTHYLLRRA